MNASSTPSTASRSALRPAIAAAALAFTATVSCSAAWGQSASTSTDAVALAATPPSVQPIAGVTAPGRTRAQVIAELECARASGEMEAALLRSYSLDMVAPRPTSTCGGAARAALASQPAPVAAH